MREQTKPWEEGRREALCLDMKSGDEIVMSAKRIFPVSWVDFSARP